MSETKKFTKEELEEINALKTNPEYIELIARKNLGLVHASELIYYLPPSETNSYHKDN